MLTFPYLTSYTDLFFFLNAAKMYFSFYSFPFAQEEKHFWISLEFVSLHASKQYFSNPRMA